MVLCAVIKQIIVGDGDGPAFFETFNLGIIAETGVLRGEGAVGTSGEPSIAQGTGGDDGDSSEATGEFVLEEAIFGPGIEAVEDNGFLTGRDEVLSLGNGLAADPILAFGGADHLAEFFFTAAIRGALNAAFGHFGIDHVAKVNFGEAHRGEIVDDYGFAAAGHADDGENIEI